MINKRLIEFLCEGTACDDLENENLLHEFPEFGKEVGAAINNDCLINVTKELSDRLQEMDLYKASLLSNFIGFACEEKEDTSAGQGVIKLFSRACEKVYELFQHIESKEESFLLENKSELYEKNKDWARAYFGFNILCVSAMAFLTRDTDLRLFLAELGISEQIRYLSEDVESSPYLKSVYYVNCILNTCSDLKLLVLFPEKEKGFFATANDLKNCFHLLCLLEEQIYENLAEEYNMNALYASDPLLALAHGEYPKDCWDQSYTTYFMECNYSSALHKKFNNEDAMSLIWGEMPPQSIPQIDGRAVIVLFDGGLNRSFSAQFLAVFHSALQPYVEIEKQLSDAEYNAWIEKIKKLLLKK